MLDEILRSKRIEIERAKRERTVNEMLRDRPPASRPFLRAPLDRTGFILEFKRRSPSTGTLRGPCDPGAVARTYAPFADAVSVLTDAPFFGGSLEDLRRARTAIDLPVLRKDFILDPWQVVESRWAGADAVLLILSALDDSAWRDCSVTARDLGMTVLTEVHTDSELERALSLGASHVGINSRNLATLQVDTGVVARLAPRVPAGRIVVAESGIRSHADVRALRDGVDAFLVGTALMRADDTASAARRLVHGEVKICGLTRAEDARLAWEAGATWGGLVFAGESPRRLEESAAMQVRCAAPLRWAGVFVDETPSRVGRLARHLDLDAVQLHGEETPETVASVRRFLPAGCEIWKAHRVTGDIPRLLETGSDRMLLDSADARRRGGTGRRFDWSLLKGHPDLDRVILAGGIDASHAVDAQRSGAGMLDVGSGVESAPGVKDGRKLASLFAALRGRGREGAGGAGCR